MSNKMTTVDVTIGSAIFQAEHPYLYHYTTKAGLEGIFGTNTIWATEYRHLNDASEVIHLREPFISALVPEYDAVMSRLTLSDEHRALYDQSGGSLQLAQDFVNSLYQSTFESQTGITAVQAFIASFCTHSADEQYERENGLLSQWRGYSGGDGYCVVFDTPELCRLLGEEFDAHYWVHLQVKPVRYLVQNVALTAHFPLLMQAGPQTLEKLLSGVREPEMGIAEFLESATLLKHQGFREEREVRIVAIPGTAAMSEQAKQEDIEFPNNPIPDIRPRPEGGPPRIALFEGRNVKLPINRVIVGPSRNQKEKEAWAKELLGEAVPVRCSATPWLPPAS